MNHRTIDEGGTMQAAAFYNVMPDGTVKQLNPFTGTEVWAVPGRRTRPMTNQAPVAPKPLEVHSPEDYCSFCPPRYFEAPPEKSRLTLHQGQWQKIDFLPPDRYNESVAEFRRVGNMFEIVTLDYWRKNYSYKMIATRQKWKEEYLANPTGLKHITDIIHYKMRQEGKTDEQIEKIPMTEKLAIADAFFGGGHELIIARRHYKDGAQNDLDLYSSGEMTIEDHFRYFKFSIDALQDVIHSNRYVRYVSVFQNWLRPAGASFDHLHKQMVALDEWGASIENQIRMLRQDPNVFNQYGANFAAHHNLVFAENDHAIAFAGIGHRSPTIEIYSRAVAGRPYEHSDDEIRGISNLVHAVHAAMGSRISCNEEWYYTPVDAVYKMPWHVLIKWRINVPAGFEGGTSIFINPMTPIELRDKLVPRLYQLRDENKIDRIRIAEECRVDPNPLKYYLR
jgi:galactose-1-phosphate uridylyltransferase